MAGQLLHTDSADAASGLDGLDNNQVRLVVVKAYVRLAAAWKLTNSIAGEMISVSPRTWTRMKDGTWNGSLDQDRLMRISALIGLYKALHLYFGDTLADRWVTLPNAGPMFSGRKPIDVMMEGGLPMMMETRNYVDALRGGM